jgi:anti-sigma factor RsiW
MPFSEAAVNASFIRVFVIMQCKKVESLTSAYLDRRLSEREASAFHSHLSECGPCRSYLMEVEEVSLALRRSDHPEAPRELRSNVMNYLERRAKNQISAGERVTEWLMKFNPRPMSYAAGVVASTILFAFLLSGLKPIPATGTKVERAAILPVMSGSNIEYHAYNDLPRDNASSDDGQYYQLPRVLNNSALVSFSHIAYQKAGDEGMAALVEVDADGSARLVNVLDEPGDPYLVEQLWWSLSNRTFQPAIVEGHAAPTRIVLLVEKMDVGG